MKAATPGSAAGAKFPFKRFTGAVFHFAGACADVQVFPPSFPFVLQSLPFFKRPSPGVHPWSHCQGGGHSLDVSAGALEDQFAPRSRELDGLDPETVLGATEWTARFGQPSWRGYRALFFSGHWLSLGSSLGGLVVKIAQVRGGAIGRSSRTDGLSETRASQAM